MVQETKYTLKNEIARLRNEQDHQQEEINTLNNENYELKQEIKQLKESIKICEEERLNYAYNLDQFRKENESLRVKLDDAKQVIADLTA